MGIQFTERDRAELNRLRRKLDSIRGPGITNTPDSISFHAPNKKQLNTGIPSAPFWIKITGSTAIPSTFNRWEYGWVEQIVNKLGMFQDKPAGRTSTSTGYKAYNSIEANNAETGTQGNSINVADLPPEATLLPVSGSPVVMAWLKVNCDGDMEVYFSYENAVKPICEEIPEV